MTIKATNYTQEQEARIVEFVATVGGKADITGAEILAKEFGKSIKSVTAKLSRLGLYKAKEYTRKDGYSVQKKDEFADAIGKVLNLSEPEVDSLTKANRKALEAIFNALAKSAPVGGE